MFHFQSVIKIAEIIQNIKNTAWAVIISDFNFYSRTPAVNTAQYWHRNRHIGQWNRIQDSDTALCNYSSLSFDKRALNTHRRKNCAGKIG